MVLSMQPRSRLAKWTTRARANGGGFVTAGLPFNRALRRAEAQDSVSESESESQRSHEISASLTTQLRRYRSQCFDASPGAGTASSTRSARVCSRQRWTLSHHPPASMASWSRGSPSPASCDGRVWARPASRPSMLSCPDSRLPVLCGAPLLAAPRAMAARALLLVVYVVVGCLCM